MNPEYGVPTRDFHVSVLEVKCIVTGSHLLPAVFDPLAELGWGQVGYSRNAECGGGDRGSWDIDEGPRRRIHTMQSVRGLDTLERGGRDVDVDRSGRKVLRNESDGSFDFCRDFSGYRILLFFPFTHFCLPGPPLFFLFALQPRGVELAKFLITIGKQVLG